MKSKWGAFSLNFKSEGNSLFCESFPPGVCALRYLIGSGIWGHETEKVLKTAFLIFSTWFQNLLIAVSLKGGTIALDLSFHLKAHTPKEIHHPD